MKKRTLVLVALVLAALTLPTLTPLSVFPQSGRAAASAAADAPVVRIVMPCSHLAADGALVDAAISEITMELLGCRVETQRIRYASWVNQTNVMLANNEPIDLLGVYTVPLATYVANGQVLPLNDLLAEYGQGITGAVDPLYLSAGEISGEMYGITTNRDFANRYGFFFNKEIADRSGVRAEDIHTLDDLHDALALIHANEPELILTVPESGLLLSHPEWDYLGSTNKSPLGVLLLENDDTRVVNLFETASFVEWVTRMRQWYVEGLILPDAMSNRDSQLSMIQTGKVFGGFSHTNPITLASKIRDTKMALDMVEFGESYAASSTPQLFMWSIPARCENPALAMRVLNLMYTNADIVNLFIFGIEGVHYRVVDAQKSSVDYIEGTDISNSRYPANNGWSMGNQFIGKCNWLYGAAPDVWEEIQQANRDAVISNAMGWSFDSSGVAAEVSACTAICDRYFNGLLCGALDPVTTLPRLNSELKSAGLEKIILAKQTQLDAWLLRNKQDSAGSAE